MRPEFLEALFGFGWQRPIRGNCYPIGIDSWNEDGSEETALDQTADPPIGGNQERLRSVGNRSSRCAATILSVHAKIHGSIGLTACRFAGPAF